MKVLIAPKPKEQVQVSKKIWPFTISFIITGLIVGSGVFLWQKSNQKNAEQRLQQQITQLLNQVNDLQKENIDSTTSTSSRFFAPRAHPESTSNIQLPVVIYGRGGLLENTPEGLIEKKNLEEKLVQPYTDHYGKELIAMYITVPENIGEHYVVLAIFGREKEYGSSQFRFGAREKKYEYWKPEPPAPQK